MTENEVYEAFKGKEGQKFHIILATGSGYDIELVQIKTSKSGELRIKMKPFMRYINNEKIEDFPKKGEEVSAALPNIEYVTPYVEAQEASNEFSISDTPELEGAEKNDVVEPAPKNNTTDIAKADKDLEEAIEELNGPDATETKADNADGFFDNLTTKVYTKPVKNQNRNEDGNYKNRNNYSENRYNERGSRDRYNESKGPRKTEYRHRDNYNDRRPYRYNNNNNNNNYEGNGANRVQEYF